MSEILVLENIRKSFKDVNSELLILDNVNLAINKGESVSIIGASGSGKSTLLHIASLVDRPTSGRVIVDSKDTTGLDDNAVADIRKTNFGFMFQKGFLFPSWSALDNILLPVLIQDKDKKEYEGRALKLLERFSLKERAHFALSKLSTGERSRVALIRALITEAPIIFADEPTGSLDRDNAMKVEEELLSLVKEENRSLLLVTHSLSFASKTDRCFEIVDRSLKEVRMS